jgi:DTW domain-containing protein YfiP
MQNKPYRETCWQCVQTKELCLCTHVHKFATKTHFVILIHPKEYKKEKIGTGRLTHASLPNSSLIVGIDFSNNDKVNQIINNSENQCLLLYPGENAVKTSELQSTTHKKLIIFILDGTWACARKMYNRSQNLQTLAKISITPTAPSLFIIKQQPKSLCLSTMEAAIYVLKDLEQAKIEINHDWDKMLTPFKLMIQRQITFASSTDKKSYRGVKGFDFKAIQQRALQGTRKKRIVV